MGSQDLALRNIGIYHNLPDFDTSLKGLTAIVTGANGISGFHTMRALLDAPHRWSKIYCLSRRPPPERMLNLLRADQRARIQHVACDFLDPGDKIAKALKMANVTATHVFFYSYLQPKPPPGQPIWSNAEELVKVNSALLANFLDALSKAEIKPKRILLQTGAKNYGVHLGRTRTPSCESDPQPKHLGPNFYYPQEELLFQYCEKNNIEWNVIMPAWIIGATNNAQMNALHPFAVYAAVQARKREPLSFAGDWNAWQNLSFHSTARMTGYLSEWAVLEDKCRNQKFNAIDDSPFSWDRFFHELSRWFDVEEGVTQPFEDDSRFQEIVGASGKDTPMGHGPPTKVKMSATLSGWANEDVNQRTWRMIMDSSNGKITHNPFEDIEGNFSCGDAAWITVMLSVNKARLLGWTGFVDTMESVHEMYKEMAEIGMLPPMSTNRAKTHS